MNRASRTVTGLGRPALAWGAVGAVALLGMAYASCASGPPPGDYERALRESREAETGAGAGTGGAEPSGAPSKAPVRAEDSPRAAEPEDPQPADAPPEPAPLRVLKGRASYYADSLAGNPTASGEPYDPAKLTAASRDLPFGTRVRVVRMDDGRSVVVRINDRGPFNDRSRIVDLSRAAAERIGMIRAGVVEVRVEVLSVPEG